MSILIVLVSAALLMLFAIFTKLSNYSPHNVLVEEVSENVSDTANVHAEQHFDVQYVDDCNYCCKESTLPFLAGSLLYLRPFEGGFVCGGGSAQISDTIDASGDVTSVIKGGSEHPHFKWDFGFRVAAGFEVEDKGWDAGVYWTHFDTKENMHVGKGGSLHWNLHFDDLDLIIGRKIQRGSCFSVRPFAGLRGDLIKQRISRSLSSTVAITTPTSVSTSVSTEKDHDKETFIGVGPLLGFEAEFHFTPSWSFYGSIDAALLYGHFLVKFGDQSAFALSTASFKANQSFDTCQTADDATLGIRCRCSLGNALELLLQAGLEHHRVFNFNQIGDYGDLSLDGASFSLGLIF